MTTAQADSAFRELRQELRKRVHITDVLQRCGIPFRLTGDRRGRALCPFHPDRRRPSLQFGLKQTPDEGEIEVWRCWTCNMSGDAITLVQMLGGYASRGDTIKALAAEHGLPYPGKRTGESGAQRVLDQATEYYAARLAGAPLRYLAERGLPEGLLQRFRVGYAPGAQSGHETGLVRLMERLELDRIAESLGLIQPSAVSGLPRRDFFFERIIFPNLTAAGHTTDLQGRAFPDRDPKYLALPDRTHIRSRVRLYNTQACAHAQVLLCEGIPDTLSATLAGFPAVGLYGTHSWQDGGWQDGDWTDGYRVLFRNARRVYVAMHPDAVRIGIHIARQFGTAGRVLLFPQELGEHGDLNDWLVGPAKSDPAQFKALLLRAMDDSPTPWELWIDRLPDVPWRERHDQLLPLLRDLATLPRTLRDSLVEALHRKTGISGVSLAAAIAELEDELATPWFEETP